MTVQRTVVAIVDDDHEMLRALRRVLEASGFATETFASAEAFLDREVEGGASCLVLDIHLGGMSGFDLQCRLKALGRNLPIIFITAVDDERLRCQAIDAGCAGYLHKPFPATSLINAINKAAKSRGLNERAPRP